jgi:hypothetical protein
MGETARRIESLMLGRMEKLAVRAGELCQPIMGGMRDRGGDVRTIAIEISARDGCSDQANWTAHLTNWRKRKLGGYDGVYLTPMPRPGAAMIS